MKRALFTFIAIVAVTFSASAQQEGEQTLGFNLGYNTGKTTTKVQVNNELSNTSSLLGGDNLSAGIEYGYFAADKLRVGFQIGYGYTANADDAKSHALTIMPNVAYYVRLAENFYYTPNFSIGFGLGIIEHNEYSDDNFTMHGLATELQPLAVEFRPTKRFAMSVSLCSLQYTFLSGSNSEKIFNTEITTKVNNNVFNFSLLANAQIGFKLYF